MSEKEKIEIRVIDALDHFSTEYVDEKSVIIRFIGEYIGEDDKYLTLRYIIADIKKGDESACEVMKIIKSTIIKDRGFEIEV